MLVEVFQKMSKLDDVFPEKETLTLAVVGASIVLTDRLLVIMLLPKLFCTMTVMLLILQ